MTSMQPFVSQSLQAAFGTSIRDARAAGELIVDDISRINFEKFAFISKTYRYAGGLGSGRLGVKCQRDTECDALAGTAASRH